MRYNQSFTQLRRYDGCLYPLDMTDIKRAIIKQDTDYYKMYVHDDYAFIAPLTLEQDITEQGNYLKFLRYTQEEGC